MNANLHIWKSSYVLELSEKIGKTPIQVYFRALIHEGVHPLYGTTNSLHMDEVMDLFSFSLEKEQCDKIKKLGYY